MDNPELTLSALIAHALIGKLGHDLVGPLGTQRGYLDLLDGSDLGEGEQDFLRRVRRQTDKSLETIDAWRTGIEGATQDLRKPVHVDEFESLVGATVTSDGDASGGTGPRPEHIPLVTTFAARLCVQAFRATDSAGPMTCRLVGREEASSVQVILGFDAELTGCVSEGSASGAPGEDQPWPIFVAKLLLKRAHGTFDVREANPCVLALGIPQEV